MVSDTHLFSCSSSASASACAYLHDDETKSPTLADHEVSMSLVQDQRMSTMLQLSRNESFSSLSSLSSSSSFSSSSSSSSSLSFLCYCASSDPYHFSSIPKRPGNLRRQQQQQQQRPFWRKLFRNNKKISNTNKVRNLKINLNWRHMDHVCKKSRMSMENANRVLVLARHYDYGITITMLYSRQVYCYKPYSAVKCIWSWDEYDIKFKCIAVPPSFCNNIEGYGLFALKCCHPVFVDMSDLVYKCFIVSKPKY